MILDKLKILEELTLIVKEHKSIVFTNGCFDIIHAGHIDYLTKAKALGDILVVGVNSDTSIQRIKGNKRPIIPLQQRLTVLNALSIVDYLVVFEEDTPINLIKRLKPNILVKGADWKDKTVVGQDIVEANGGRVELIEFANDISTSKIIEKIIRLYS